MLLVFRPFSGSGPVAEGRCKGDGIDYESSLPVVLGKYFLGPVEGAIRGAGDCKWLGSELHFPELAKILAKTRGWV